MVKTFLKSPAKINLSLKIGKKINHKYHDIQSIIFLIKLYDQITIKIYLYFLDLGAVQVMPQQ